MLYHRETYAPEVGWIVTTYENCRICEANISRAVDLRLQEKIVNGYAWATVWLVDTGWSLE
jgi:hypothetical protein